MFKRKRKLCTEMTDGIIIQMKANGPDRPTVITVRYIVDTVSYEIKDNLKLKSSLIKLGPAPVGQRKTPVIPATGVGSTVRVSYNPDKPAMAYLTDNIGIMNC